MPIINDLYDHVEYIETALGSSANLLTEMGKELAAERANLELGCTYPISKPVFQIWAIERGKRHAIDILRVEAAHRFKYKQLSLNNRFQHYNALIEALDKEFEEAMMELMIQGGKLTFYIESGFVYDHYGNDITKYVHKYFQELVT